MSAIRILATGANARGDLFCRLMGDFFLALGYDDCHFDVSQAGREVDILARHRFESRVAVAECKATKDLIGGDDFNKFYGVLDLEQRKDPDTPVQGYFISLGGFRETALEQEAGADNARFIAVDGAAVVAELVKGRIIVSPTEAAAAAGRAAAGEASDLKMDGDPELLAEEAGWIWAVYFHKNHDRTHVALVHADGQLLGPGAAGRVIAADAACGGPLQKYDYLGSPERPGDESNIRDDYFGYLAREFGHITLEGLPADQEVGAREIVLENLFVPMELEPAVAADEDAEPDDGHDPPLRPEPDPDAGERVPVGHVLADADRIAILAPPGGGKSTLLKRLAVAYAWPDRRKATEDYLPDRDWFPLMLRCRQLEELVRAPLLKTLQTIPQRAEMAGREQSFMSVVTDALREGRVLLLIDGLDEISDEGDRVAFVRQLRTFLATYPAVSVVVTSREPGFRAVAGALSTACSLYRIGEFTTKDITRLTLAWHAEVVGESEENRRAAEILAERITRTDRVRRLATNPLLLTTLLLVKRWVGDLPRKRSVLYGKAIEVLLMTWNVEGHEPIDPEEAIPQLAFVATAMTQLGSQSLSSRQLTDLLRTAREQMPEILGYARIPVHEFVRRVEDRSSVLSLSGHVEEAGALVPRYEFKHLTFQEYLAARGLADGYYPDRRDEDDLGSVLEPHFGDPTWREVIPLTAVLAGRRAAGLVRKLIDRISEEPLEFIADEFSGRVAAKVLLAQCLADEVQLAPNLVDEAAAALSQADPYTDLEAVMLEVFESRYGDRVREVIRTRYLAAEPGFANGDMMFAWLAEYDFAREPDKLTIAASGWPERIIALLKSDDPQAQARGATVYMLNAFRHGNEPEHRETLASVVEPLLDCLDGPNAVVRHTATWAVAWLASRDLVPAERRLWLARKLFGRWRFEQEDEVSRKAAWAFAEMPLLDRSDNPLGVLDEETADFLVQEARDERPLLSRIDRAAAALMAMYYFGGPWSDEELAAAVNAVPQSRRKRFGRLLRALEIDE